MVGRLRFDNPILTKELRTRMRGARAFWVLFVYIAILSLILFVTYMSWWQSQRGSLGGMGGGAFTVGKIFYSVLFTVQGILVGIITPALTAGGVSVEKEQRTLDLLQISLLPRRSIVVGKLVAALAFVGLLLTSSLPLVSIGFLLGGVSPGEVASTFGLLLLTAFVYGAVGIACSSVARNTTSATVMTYGTIGLLFFATLPLAMLAVPGMLGAPGGGMGRGVGLTAINPIGAMAAGTLKETYFGISVPAWLTSLVVNGLFGTILTLVAVHRLDYPRTDRSGLLRFLTALLVGVLAFCVCGLFLPGNSAFGGSTFIVVAMVAVLSVIPLVTLYATAEGLPSPGGVWTLFDPRRLGRGEAPSGLLYILLLVGLIGVIAYSGALFGPSGAGRPQLEGQIARLTLLTATAAWFFGALGLFFSALVRNRWSAMSLVASVLVLLYLIPFTVSLSRAYSSSSSPADNFFYLSPMVGALDISENAPNRNGPRYASLLGGATPIDRVSSVLFGVGGLILLFAAHGLHHRRERDQSVVSSQ
jgi:ABC-type transport system involved in multi-copper enzyme maturation permease subunit